MVCQIYHTELQLDKTNFFDTDVPFLDLDLYLTNSILTSKLCNKWDDFSFEIVNFPSLDGHANFYHSYCVLINFAAYSLCKSMF